MLIVNALFHPFQGGVERHALELATELVKQGVDVHVLTGRIAGTSEEEKINGIKIHRVACTELRIPRYYPPPMIVAPKFYRKLAELDGKEEFDVIHLQDRWFPDFNLSLLYAKAHAKPSVLTLHNARTVGIAPHYTVLGGLYDQLIGKRCLKDADKIISVSAWSARDIQHLKVPASKITVIHNGIDTQKFKPMKSSSFKKKFGINGPLVLFVGRVIRQKGLEYLLHAMVAVKKKFPHASLAVIGRGNKLEKIRKLSKKLHADAIFPGFVAEKELQNALCECDAFVLPSLWEVLPISILEAMACGKPIVCSDAGGNSELVADGENGFVVPKRNSQALANALIRVIGDRALATRMGAESRRRAINEFGWKRIAAETISLYKQAMRESKGKKPAGETIEMLGFALAGKKIDFRKYLEKFASTWKVLEE